MTPETERQLRAEAQHLRSRGVLTWDARLLAHGLDPDAWAEAARHQRDAAIVGQTAHRTAPLSTKSYDADKSTIEVVWSTGAAVARMTWEGPYTEVLDMSPRAVRLDRLNARAPFLNTHATYDLGCMVGSVVPGSARVGSGKGSATVQLSRGAAQADFVADIAAGVIRCISVAYIVHACSWTEAADGSITCTVTDWEPYEISAVPVPADIGAQIL